MGVNIDRTHGIAEVPLRADEDVSASCSVAWASGGLIYFPAEWAEGDLGVEMETPEGEWAEMLDAAGDPFVVLAHAGKWVELPPGVLLGHRVRFTVADEASSDHVLVVALKG